MKLNRRQVFSLGTAAVAAMLASGCGERLEQRLTRPELAQDAFAPVNTRATPTAHLINRVSFGPCPGELHRVSAMGMSAYIDEQLNPEQITETPTLTWRLRGLGDILDADAGLLFDVDDHRVVQALRQATILRAVYSKRQLYERMVEFWNDHFNIYAFKGEGAQLKILDDRETIRPHALGRFRDLLGASARSAAMLGYLDNGTNHRGMPNENYARELMELHTLGVHGGYTQRDVQEVARCLTGWSSQLHWHRGRFVFLEARHDDGPKCVLGTQIAPHGGIADGERVLDILAAHPATALHLSRKLCLHFVGAAPASLVTHLAKVYAQTEGDIKSLIRTLLTSPEFQKGPAIFKRPFDYLVSALRAFNADTDGELALQEHLDKMGQPLFAWPMPNGFPEGTAAWTGTLLPRWNFALALTNKTIGSTSIDLDSLTQSAERTGLSWPTALLNSIYGHNQETLSALHARLTACSNPVDVAALALMAPAFQWR